MFLDPSQDVLCQKALPGFRLCSPTVEYPWREKCFNSTITSGRTLKSIFRSYSVSLVLSTDPSYIKHFIFSIVLIH